MILAVLQARVSSSRLPGKVLLDLAGKPMLERQVERVRRASRIDRLVIATSINADDDPIESLCAKIGVDCHRGSLDDVLDRFVTAAERFDPEWVVRLTGDCPLADPDVIDAVIDHTLEAGADYGCNTQPPTFPDGLDVELVRMSALREAAAEARSSVEREHVTPFFYRRPERYRLTNLAHSSDLSAMRWTVDEPRDLEFVRAIYAALYPADPAFGMAAVLEFLDRHPDLAELNDSIERNEGLARSIAKEKFQ